MCGWLSLPASAASARNALCIMRSVCGLMFSSNRNTLMATSRSAKGSRARYTRLVAPLPISRTIGYLPRCSWSSNFIAIGRVSWKNARSGGAPRPPLPGQLKRLFEVRLGNKGRLVLERFLLPVPHADSDPHGELVQPLARRCGETGPQLGLGAGVPGRSLDRGVLEIILVRARVNEAVAFIHGDAVLTVHSGVSYGYVAVHISGYGDESDINQVVFHNHCIRLLYSY